MRFILIMTYSFLFFVSGSNCQQLVYSNYYFNSAALSIGGVDVERTSDNCYLITGTGYPFHGDTRYFLLKLNSLGDTIWYRTDSFTNPLSEGKSVVELSNGNYAICSSHYPQLVNSYLSIYDPNGNLVSQKTYSDTISIDVSRHYEFGGSIYLFSRYGDPGPNQNKSIIIKTDLVGDSLSSRILQNFRVYNDQKSVIQQNGFFYMTGFSPPDSIHSFAYPSIIKLDSNVNEVWRFSYPLNGDFTGTQICMGNDSGFVLTVEGLSGKYLIKIDSLGNIEWQQPLMISKFCLSCPPISNRFLIITQDLDLNYYNLNGISEPPVSLPISSIYNVSDSKVLNDSIIICGYDYIGSSPLITSTLLAIVSDSNLTGLVDFEDQNNVLVYPTTAFPGDVINVHGCKGFNSSLEIFSLDGSTVTEGIKVKRVNYEMVQIVLPSDIKSGVYILKVNSKEQVSSFKMIIL